MRAAPSSPIPPHAQADIYTSDTRLSAILSWLAGLGTPHADSTSLRPASADASFRRYFRVDTDQGSRIVMDAPPEHEDIHPFMQVAALLAKAGVTVPQVIAHDDAQGFLLLSDLGSITYLQHLNADNAPALYLDAIDALVQIQLSSRPGVLPEYDRTLLARELDLFPDWYIGRHLNAQLNSQQQAQWQQVVEALLANNLAQPQVFVHRDYHSRNLMLQTDGALRNPGILDFQDAVYGPITYDLVSLLRDAYIRWDEELVLDWVIRYWERARRAGLPVTSDIDTFYRDFEFMGLQRHLKVLGIFARLSHRDGKDAYLNDLPLVLDYARRTAGRYRELKPLLRILDSLEQKTPQVGYTF
ncbi:MAG: phosphotransferase [Herbaspirillum sp.]